MGEKQIDFWGSRGGGLLSICGSFWDQNHYLLLEWTFFFTKYGHENIVFFWEYRLFGQNVGMRAVTFSWKNGKKGILLTFLAHNIF